MSHPLDPKQFGLPARTVLEHNNDNAITIVILRKSRIIMQDGKNIVVKAEKIRAHIPQAVVSLRTTAPVCSKTLKFLQQHGIAMVSQD